MSGVSQLLVIANLALVLPGAALCAARIRQSWWSGVAAAGFALEAWYIVFMWAGPAGVIDVDPLNPIVMAIISTPVVGLVAIGAIAIGVAVPWWRVHNHRASLWAMCVGGGIALHWALITAASMATRVRWHMNGFGKPDGALAFALPSGHMFAQLAILVGAVGMSRVLDVRPRSAPPAC